MKKFLMFVSVWVLCLNSVRGNIVLGQFETDKECQAAIIEERTGVLTWKTFCKEIK
ncbi:hypothetical protein [Leptospira tipperaryensis]|uniref:hypothetical protein n=1 Tax=Leptospira tipperaryensis TaxID=2564040 RepID=UPI0012EA7A7E|nr:hypothetical protein [Leptospira tipperaryensis]